MENLRITQCEETADVEPEESLALKADPLLLYEKSVQDSDTMIPFIERIYRSVHNTLPLRLREDFCGTARMCADWIRSSPERKAVGIDIDRPTLDWGMVNNILPLGMDASRVRLVERDVIEGFGKNFDVILALNFSYSTFHRRRVLLDYFRSVRRSLADGGMLVLDIYGGPEAQYVMEEESDCDGFEYVWEQESFDPINNRTVCHIHFRFEDGSEIEKAFSYDWRLWTIPEIREVLLEAGFRSVQTWWEGMEDDDHFPAEEGENLYEWLAYLAAWA